MEKADKTTRKRGDDVDRRSKKLRVVVEEQVVAAAEDEEVEEFFAILRRMHDAVKHFGGGRKVASGVLRKALETDPVAEITAAAETPPEQREEIKANDKLLDLNTAPEPEPSNGDCE